MDTQTWLEHLLKSAGVRDWEKQQLATAASALAAGQREKPVLAKLEAALRPLALRDNLTPDVAIFIKA